ncbi:MAG: undecaprenyl-diphosphatase UppP [Candidatus Magasanikbacteria bacterium]|jgi:undecaprenyl-diphosphatase|nr:undecaprenyl-diphosphatase UppP [Candidatus Magasanikbacteria bacterium]MBT4221103.1 undecaprenyl-diphosphatase UppP [Candidatus Magasanikbacteria bacterium]MBT4350553.1 undecaprenyl-diphosphatase UppP [Candidatus Magasanikbacteria bacterium]MBT4542148.1 undecaprenyl-diphosphatase UppP [Candidatus Magasanikbacteria bacterium]MBT6253270.1 undecaprenyl-diphosphatase UppP [Candidatus Magasanikbacteria bacterium]
MEIMQAIVLGIVQGITEFLPVSSSGHLIFIPKIFGWQDQGILFDITVHVGTLLAVICFLRKRIATLIQGFFSTKKEYTKERRLAWFILISMVPTAIVGILVKTNNRSALVIGISFIVWGVILGVADRYQAKRERQHKIETETKDISFKQMSVMAIAQVIALIPGTSRSGITMTGGLFSHMSKKAAAEFSFLMSIPIIAAAGVLGVLDVSSHAMQSQDIFILIIGLITSFVSAMIAMWGFMKVISKWSYMPFVVYRVLVGIAILAFLV